MLNCKAIHLGQLLATPFLARGSELLLLQTGVILVSLEHVVCEVSMGSSGLETRTVKDPKNATLSHDQVHCVLVFGEIDGCPQKSFPSVQILFRLQDMEIEELLKAFVAKVYAKLFERI